MALRHGFRLFSDNSQNLIVSMNRLMLPLALLMLVSGGAVIALSQRPWAPRADVVQPIPFSHRIHAGVNKIPCQYCHAYASRSSEPGIPAVARCVGCHGNGIAGGGIAPVTRAVDGRHAGGVRDPVESGVHACPTSCASRIGRIFMPVSNARAVTGRYRRWIAWCRCMKSTWAFAWTVTRRKKRRSTASAVITE